jgi:hypothetical protein
MTTADANIYYHNQIIVLYAVNWYETFDTHPEWLQDVWAFVQSTPNIDYKRWYAVPHIGRTYGADLWVFAQMYALRYNHAQPYPHLNTDIEYAKTSYQ